MSSHPFFRLSARGALLLAGLLLAFPDLAQTKKPASKAAMPGVKAKAPTVTKPKHPATAGKSRHAVPAVKAPQPAPQSEKPLARPDVPPNPVVMDEPVAPPVAPRPLPPVQLLPSQLQPDMRLLREALGQLHPGAYRHVDSVEVDRRFEQLINGPFSQPTMLPDAYRELAILLAGLRDAHTYPNPLNQTKAVRAALFEQPNAVPFRFNLVDKQMVVTGSMAPELPRGAEILKLDGRPVAEILDTLLTATRGDGANTPARLRRLWVDGSEQIHAFDALFPLFYPVGKTIAVEFRRNDDDEPRAVVVAAVKATDREATMGSPYAAGAPLGWKMVFSDARTARLTLPDFATWKAPDFDWRKWLADAFNTMRQKRAEALIVDIRQCEGGTDEVAQTLLTYLIKKPMRLPPERQLWRTDHISPAMAPMLDTWNPALKQLKPSDFRRTPDDYYERVDAPTSVPIAVPDKLAFEGKSLYVLCGPRNSSAAFRLLQVLKENKVATLVGQPSGGNRRGITGGQMFFLRLPNTGLEVDLPLVSYQPLRAQPDEGIMPDELIEQSVAALRKGMDPEMVRVTELLREDRQE